MEAKLAAVLASSAQIPVTVLCAELGISRQTFYTYRRRWAEEGPPGLVERSRRPHRSPQLMAADVEDEIVRIRKALAVDNGAQAIAYHLARGGWPTPSVSAIHRALRRRGLVVDQPQKRPRSSWRRFEWPRPNDAWQIDATRWALADGREIWIMDVLDDHSRVLVAARVCSQPTSAAAWDAFGCGAADWGLPARLMSDNGTCFTGRFLDGGENRFERNLRDLGIQHLLSSPAHPQTCGKLERSHQTTKRWLGTQPAARTAAELQDQLDTWRTHYNHQRPHRALAGATPAERWNASEPAAPAEAIELPPRAGLRRVTKDGTIGWDTTRIGVGSPLAGQDVLVVARGNDITIWCDQGRIRQLTIDPARRYHGTGRPPGRRPHPHT